MSVSFCLPSSVEGELELAANPHKQLYICNIAGYFAKRYL